MNEWKWSFKTPPSVKLTLEVTDWRDNGFKRLFPRQRWTITGKHLNREFLFLLDWKPQLYLRRQDQPKRADCDRIRSLFHCSSLCLSVLFSEFSLCWPLREKCLPLSWSIPSQRQDTPGQNHTVQFPVSLFAIMCRLDSVCPVKHVPPLKKHPWALFKLDGKSVHTVGQLF